jgi:RNA ligase (TIGR02306 family)
MIEPQNNLKSRHLASVQQIVDIQPIENADSIELVKILGWSVVTKKGQFKIGDPVVMFEIDSILPKTEDFEFLKDKHYKVKTSRMRGAISQGLCMPLSILPEGHYELGDDVTEILGVTKYEKPIPVQLRGRVRCPIHRLAVPKTEEVRVQNIPDVLERHKGKVFYLTEKIDGANMNIYLDPETGLHVCSRNVDLKQETIHPRNGDSYWRYTLDHNLEEILKQLGGTVALQGELCGEGIQGNKYKLKGLHYRVFNMWDMVNHVYLDYQVMVDAVETFGLGSEFLVPSLGQLELNHTVDELVSMADGVSKLADGVPREGIVFRPVQETIDYKIGRLSWKAISKKFLLEYKE